MSDKILILEDEVGIRSFVAINLKREGYEVIEAQNGQEALEKISENNIKIALLDVMLPDINGTDVCKYIRQNFENVGIIRKVITSPAVLISITITLILLGIIVIYKPKEQKVEEDKW